MATEIPSMSMQDLAERNFLSSYLKNKHEIYFPLSLLSGCKITQVAESLLKCHLSISRFLAVADKC